MCKCILFIIYLGDSLKVQTEMKTIKTIYSRWMTQLPKAYLLNWSRAAHTRIQYLFWSPLVVSSKWSKSSRGYCPPGLPVSSSRSPCFSFSGGQRRARSGVKVKMWSRCCERVFFSFQLFNSSTAPSFSALLIRMRVPKDNLREAGITKIDEFSHESPIGGVSCPAAAV